MQDDGSGTREEFRKQLFRDGIIHNPNARLMPLAGGVSSDIYLVDDGGRYLVAKRALAKLRVREEWTADISRNHVEIAALRVMERLLPNLAPKLLAAPADKGYLVMEYLDTRFANWKQLLLNGQCLDLHARTAGGALGTLHQRTWGMAELAPTLGKWKDFRQLRVSPYLEALASKHPSIVGTVSAQIDHLRHCPQKCLVHGDYSPKNMLFRDSQLVILDWEVAWFGDPSFDISFLLNHLLLKAIRRKRQAADFVHLALVAWQAYADNLGREKFNVVASAVPRLLPMLMLARVDGKSPVEYLTHGIDQDIARRFALNSIVSPWSNTEQLCAAFAAFIEDIDHEHNRNYSLPDV
ncbi:MAG: phosphotransferase family protein [Phycisphaerae bacterium]